MPTLVADRYRLGAPVGRGGMGRVWRAHDQILDRDVAIKEIVPPPGLSDPEGVHRRTIREARATARLSHPGVVRVFDVLEVDGGTWIVMEYVPSRSLQEVIKADGPLPPRRVAKIGLDLLDALVAAARAGVEHRDVKPANVLLADDGRVMLTDFGIAAIADDPSNSTSDALIGSPEYMPPERTKNDHVGLASDLWSLGATLYAAVEGTSPFHRPTVAATLTALAVEDPAPPTQAGPLAPLLMELLRKNPDDRPSAGDAAKMLRTAASGAYGQASIPPSDVREETATSDEQAVADASTPAGPPVDPTLTPVGGLSPTPGELSPGVGEPAPAELSPAPAELSPVPAELSPVRAELSPAPEELSPAAPRRRRLMVAAIALIVILIGGAIVWSVDRRSGRHSADPVPPQPTTAVTTTPAAPSSGPASTPPSTSASTSAAPPTSAAPSSGSSGTSGSGLPALPPLPSGWTAYHDKTGFSVYVPQGWARSKKDQMVYFRGDGRVLGIDQTTHPKSDPLADWKDQSSYRVSHGWYPGYHQIRIASVDYIGKSADWEYTFTDGGTRVHVANRNVLASSHQAYGIYWQTTDATWSAHKDDLALVYASFRPVQS